jgi:hypothetical protein
MTRRLVFAITVFSFFVVVVQGASAQQPANGAWRFVVSGDSRNCGDVVMPGIAETAKKNQAAFYWHLGDFRADYQIDEDIQHQPEHIAKPLTSEEYLSIAWQDFIDSQVAPFGSIPFYVAIGNHEIMPPGKTRESYMLQFADWLDSPKLQAQRLRDYPGDHLLRTYYHWIDRGVAFYTMDSATAEQFDAAQTAWFEYTLQRDMSDRSVTTIVVGMHKALPESISAGHSMNESPTGTDSGRRVYGDLLRAQNDAHKRVYVLASHSHYYMDGIFNTAYWRAHGGELPGWIVGTAGAQFYALPTGSADAHGALPSTYGSLVATVQPNGDIDFNFEKLAETDIPPAVRARYGQNFVHWCFTQNTQIR